MKERWCIRPYHAMLEGDQKDDIWKLTLRKTMQIRRAGKIWFLQ